MNRIWLTVQPDGSSAILHRGEDEPTLAQMQGAVGGLIQYAHVPEGATMPLPVARGKAVMAELLDVIVNEEGLLLRMQPNYVAMMACAPEGADDYGFGGQVLVGPAILVFKMPSEEDAVPLKRDEMLMKAAPKSTESLMSVDSMMPSTHLNNPQAQEMNE